MLEKGKVNRETVEFNDAELKLKNHLLFRNDDSVATVSQDGLAEGVCGGKAEIKAQAVCADEAVEGKSIIVGKDFSGIASNGITIEGNSFVYVYGKTQLRLKAKMNSGKCIYIPQEHINWKVKEGSDTNIVTISEDGSVTGNKVGEVVLQPTVDSTCLEEHHAAGVEIAPVPFRVVWETQISPAIITLKKRENVQKNMEKYSWVRSEVKSAKAAADVYAANVEEIYDRIVPEGLPRYYYIGHPIDQNRGFCRYCGCNVAKEYGAYNWNVDALSHPWKVQCPDCKRLFPSNDFGSFYKLGLSEDKAHWSFDAALMKHHKLFACEDEKNGIACTHTALDIGKRGSEEWYRFYGYGVEGGYLTNDLYKNDPKLNYDTRWGVDDSRGYLQKYTDDPKMVGYSEHYYSDEYGNARFKNGTQEGTVQYPYIAFYLHDGVWYSAGSNARGGRHGLVVKALKALSTAFVYTGEAKYGRAGAIMLDRVADVWKDFDWYRWRSLRNDNYRGTAVDPIWSTGLASSFAEAYDAFLPIYNDPAVAEFLSTHGARYEIDENGNWRHDSAGKPVPVNLKNSPAALRKHIEEELLLQIFKQAKSGKICGNFGMHQRTISNVALAYNKLPETGEMLEWIMATGNEVKVGAADPEIQGANVAYKVICNISRDGIGNENAPGYNRQWPDNILAFAENGMGYEFYPSASLMNNVKFLKMFPALTRLTLGGYYTPQTGDSGAVASKSIAVVDKTTLAGFKLTEAPLLAQILYFQKGNSAEDIRDSIFSDDPMAVQKKVLDVIKEYGTFHLDSDMLAGYGFAALRAGSLNPSDSEGINTNTCHDFAVYFGASDGHGHADGLNLYASAYGLNIAPDLGYPEQTGSQPNRYEWVHATISHNTVVVNGENNRISAKAGTPYHFDDSEAVQLIDVAMPEVSSVVEDYRRTVMMVKVDDESSYGVDFFHVKGGNDHLYSFHSQSDEIYPIEGLNGVYEQPTYKMGGKEYGTYAGPDVEYGPDPGGSSNLTYMRGATWMKNIRKYENSGEKRGIAGKFSVEYKVKDFNKALKNRRDIRLRLTMLHNDPMKEVTFASGHIPVKANNKNITAIEYLLVRNRGEDLDTTFTTVYEPYIYGAQYIENIEKLSMMRNPSEKSGSKDSFSAVKVTLKDGTRVDYIMYSTNNEVTYTVGDRFIFRGFAGVMSYDKNGNMVCKYLNDGEILAEITDEAPKKSVAAYTGTVKDYEKSLVLENYITFIPDADQKIDAETLVGRWVYVDNRKIENGAYRIESAEKIGGDIKLDIGDVTLVSGFENMNDAKSPYIHNIQSGDRLRIPLVSVEEPRRYRKI